MQEVLQNMANHLLIEYCLAKGIDCSGTYCVKDGRGSINGFAYCLRSERPVDPRWPDIARITFHKNQVPTYGWN